jgi:thiopurine S-methyltransferase
VQPEFWHERWRFGQTAFHQNAVDKHLKTHGSLLELDADSRVFVPLCGKSLDLLWLRGQGSNVVGVEISEMALESLCAEQGIAARRTHVGDFDRYEDGKLQLLRGDFFQLTAALLGGVTAVYDRAALISWDPNLREAYVEQMAKLTPLGAKTLLIALEYPQPEMNGPPFSVGQDAVNRLYGKHSAIELLSREDILSNEPRFRSRGVTAMHEVCYLLTRR